jgi:hypothetical protein
MRAHYTGGVTLATQAAAARTIPLEDARIVPDDPRRRLASGIEGAGKM